MSDRIEREIEEILNRLDESALGEHTPNRVEGLSRDWTGNLHRATASCLAHISWRQIMFASLILVVLVAAGLFFGLVYPSLSSSGPAAGEALHESVGDQIGEGVHVDEAWPEGSVVEGTDWDGEKSEHGVDRPSEDHGEGHRGGGEHH